MNSLLSGIPTAFDVNVTPAEPLEVELKIGPKVLFLGVAALVVAVVWKKL